MDSNLSVTNTRFVTTSTLWCFKRMDSKNAKYHTKLSFRKSIYQLYEKKPESNVRHCLKDGNDGVEIPVESIVKLFVGNHLIERLPTGEEDVFIVIDFC
jgi:hypothetical protein